MRIASLVPAATEWISALGAAQDLVARSHACSQPEEVRNVPVVTRPAQVLPGRAGGADYLLPAECNEEGEIDVVLLRSVQPDLVIVPKPYASDDDPALRECLLAAGIQAPTMEFSPSTFKEVMDAALRLGMNIGRGEEAMRWIGHAEARLHALHAALGMHRRAEESGLSSLVCIDRLNPVRAAGSWVPDLVRLAGGRPILSRKGAPSEDLEWDALRAADPDVIIVAPCGCPIHQTRRELSLLNERDGWPDLKAVRAGRVYLIDGCAFLNRPGPPLYRAVELLATAIRPGLALTPPPQRSEIDPV